MVCFLFKYLISTCFFFQQVSNCIKMLLFSLFSVTIFYSMQMRCRPLKWAHHLVAWMEPQLAVEVVEEIHHCQALDTRSLHLIKFHFFQNVRMWKLHLNFNAYFAFFSFHFVKFIARSTMRPIRMIHLLQVHP